MSASDNLSTKCSGLLLRSSFAILAARARHLISAAPMPAFSVASRPSNSSDIMRSEGSKMAQCTRLDPGAALRPQTVQSFECLDAASPSRIHSSACLRSISRAKGSSVFSAAWRQSLAWCSHNSTCDDIAPTSCGQLMETRTQWRSPGWLCVANVHSSPSTFKAAYMDCR